MIKASAGAGKTHFLTQQYISMLLQGDDAECDRNYKHILAVTFTNKATEEMKSRIIQELDRIASDPDDSNSGKARRRLTALLNDYSCFSISTIDRFFQTVMRSFAREIGQYASYKVELDTEGVVAQAVDRMLDSLGSSGNADLLEWLKEYSLQTIEEGGSWNITGPLMEMSKLFFREDFKLKRDELENIISDKDAIRQFDREMSEIIRSFRSDCTRIGKEALALMDAAGFRPEEGLWKSRGPFMIFKRLASGDLSKEPQERSKFDKALEQAGVRGLEEKVDELFSLFSEENLTDYRTARLIKSNLYLLGIYTDLYKNLHEYLSENNVVLLSESNELLSRIIDGNDTPFVYEKAGTRYEHIMLDEAQDTSVMQWRNFRPLFLENIANGRENLIVGDIKQSIYRWRGSDWKLMSNYLFEDLGSNNVNDRGNLSENWRSCGKIIEFNNWLFGRVGELLELKDRTVGAPVGEIYSDCVQTQPPAHASWKKGRVKVGFLEGSQWHAEALERMCGDIGELRSAGYGYSDITVLVRKNREGSEVASYLMSKGINVITEDSLQLGSSLCVSGLVQVLAYYTDPDNPVNGMAVEHYAEGLPEACPGGSLYEICESLLALEPLSPSSGDVPFVQAFLDCVLEYQDKFGSSLRGFLSWWDKTGCKRSICAPGGQDAVRVMTIHKAKGLGLEAVIIPFLQEKFVQTSNWTAPTIWCRTGGRFGRLGLVPMKAGSELDGTIFSEQYREELLYGYVDSVNTAYVAFTRPVSQLVVYAKMPDKPSDFKIDSFGNLLYAALSGKLENGTYQVGALEKFEKVEEKTDILEQEKFDIVPMGGRLKLALKGDDFFSSGSMRRMGINMHDILSRVEVAEDLKRACGDDAEAYGRLSEHLAKVADRHWFDGTYISKNETCVVDADGSVYRPDRILVERGGGAVQVIDYKFGARDEKYRKQVGGYCALLEKAGYSPVRGYIWYVSEDNVIEI